jgi:hypothetical protein
VSFAAITLCVASQRVFIVVSEHFVIDSVRKLSDTPSYITDVSCELKIEVMKKKFLVRSFWNVLFIHRHEPSYMQVKMM